MAAVKGCLTFYHAVNREAFINKSQLLWQPWFNPSFGLSCGSNEGESIPNLLQ